VSKVRSHVAVRCGARCICSIPQNAAPHPVWTNLNALAA